MVAGNQFRHPAGSGLPETRADDFVLGSAGAIDLLHPTGARSRCHLASRVSKPIFPGSRHPQTRIRARLGLWCGLVPRNVLLGVPRHASVWTPESIRIFFTADPV